MAGKFMVVFAMGLPPAWSVTEFAGLENASVTIEMSMDGLAYAVMMTGMAENIRIDLARNNAVVSGRNLTSLLIDAEISESFVNQTASDVAELIAVRHGMVPNITQTIQRIGQYYQIDHARTALNVGSRATTEWNLLCRLAQAEGFGVSVTDNVLNFGPVMLGETVLATPKNFMALEIDRVTVLPAAVAVRSWNTRSKQAVEQRVGAGTVTTLVRPNMTAVQAGDYANSCLTMLMRHGKILLGKMPGDIKLSVGDAIYLADTNSELDDTYVVTSLTRRLGGREGFTQTVRAYAVE
ncbi:hypothetical protein [Acidocella sp.]|uniref:hypothetical protein n=1 Tax=Acidocella sp. TaxID=50710 RepID=UPI003D06D9AF